MLLKKVKEILAPYSFDCLQIPWFSAYVVGQLLCDHFDNAKNNLSRDLETQIININQNNAFQSLYPFEDVTVSKDFLLDTFEEYHVYSKYNELNYLMEDNLEKVIKILQV